MRHASPVGVTSAGGVGWALAQALLASAAAAAAFGWGAAMLGACSALQAVVAASAAAMVAPLVWRAARPRPAQLRWDGSAWSADGVVGSVALTLDLGGWMLLRFRAAASGAVRWLPLSQHDAGAAWHGLRVALYAPAAPEPRA